MDQLFNHYSFLWMALGLTVVAGLVLLTHKPGPREFISFAAIVVAVLVAWTVLHPRQTPQVTDAKSVQALIGSGKPVLLDFQSPY